MTQDWNELRNRWRESTPAQQPEDFKMQQALAKANRFDTWIDTRNRAQWLALLALLCVGALLFRDDRIAGALLCAAAVGKALILWRSGGVAPDPSPEASLRDFRAALAEKFDRQIRFLRLSRTFVTIAFAGALIPIGSSLWRALQTGGETTQKVTALAILAAAWVYLSVIRQRQELQRLAEQRDDLLEALGAQD
ncbi:MAG: hypothetical protein GC160_12645 [Acidobacteria bacterium]|nr:hypothetical protein [Acidobacteriota bacterium]